MADLIREWLDEIIAFIDIDTTLINLKKYILVLFSFILVLNILLIWKPDAFNILAQKLQKKYGFKKEFFPFLESERMGLDRFIFNNRNIIGSLGILLSIFSFYLLR
ncbi:MAG: hypothetical protein JW800_02865 [Candidatus Omnitrophica bacterium]|nr:hypothetical protein [Candidatus Omnitrophota bacterium]